MSSSVFLKAIGLQKSPNQLSLPEGSLTTASNIIIKRENVIESRRGFGIYGNSFGASSDIAKQLFTYKHRILRHYGTTLQYDSDGSGAFLSFSGSFLETETGLRIKSIEANGNFYFTTSTGIQKISATTASDFTTASGFIKAAGGVKALDLQGSIVTTPGDQTSFFTADSVVAYRVVWGTKDLNGNLVLGSPSQRIELQNSLLTLNLDDFNRVLRALDYIGQAEASPTGATIADKNYVSTYNLPYNATASELYTNISGLTSKIDNDISYASSTGTGVPLTISGGGIAEASGVVTITFTTDPTSYFSAGTKIFLAGFGSTTGTVNGAQTVVTCTAGPNVITFNATVNTPTVSSGTIKSNTFRNITVPTAPADIPTHEDEQNLQDWISNILLGLQGLPNAVIATAIATAYIDVLDVTTASQVLLKITIPADITSDYFYQVYRTKVTTAIGTDVLSDLSAGDEMALVIEDYPTTAQLSAKEVDVTDNTPDDFRGANLYTNEISGEGILQANDIPPLAKDINRFKNVIFYANTSTRQRLSISLLGVSNMITDYNNSITPKITITDGTTTNTYSFVLGRQEVTPITIGTATPGAALNGKYFLINNANDVIQYYVWYSNGTGTDPALSGKTGIKVLYNNADANTVVATKTRDVLNTYIEDFTAIASSNVFTVTNVDFGQSTDATAGTSGFTIGSITQGRGEDATLKQVLLSDATSPATAVDETARSLARVISKNTSELVNVYYLSGVNDVPGKLLFEARSLSSNPIYFLTNNSNTGDSFNPSFSPTLTITGNTIAAATEITTSTNHGLSSGAQVIISSSNSTPNIDGIYTITVTDVNKFTIPVTVTVAGTTGSAILKSDAQVTDNEQRPNRIYYSKFNEPEAVPIVNYFDVGAKDAKIFRIFPLRDSLFVFKEDGLYRISGEIAPFTVSLFDSSCNAISADSLGLANNLIYIWTTQGISLISEAGVNIITRPIDVDILKLASSAYTSFPTATWGLGYDSDNSYIVYTVQETTDTTASIGYRYSNLTNSWTTIDKQGSANCGIVNSFDDKMYLGPNDVNYIERERKTFNRYDYADREIASTILANSYTGSTIRLTSVTNINVGDALVQDQTITVYEYNVLLRKLDIDIQLASTNYLSLLEASPGDNMSAKLDSLLAKLTVDTGNGAYTALSPVGSTFALLKTAFNTMITTLNADTAVGFTNYQLNTHNTSIETIITDVNPVTRMITLSSPLNFIVGVISIFNAIECTFTYAPLTMGDPLGLKHMREATMMFANRAFTSATLSFATDLLPAFTDVDFDMSGNGIFGQSGGSGGFGSDFFGGAANSAPLRTYIPRDSQRCRYMVCKFTHKTAREEFGVFGLTLTGEVSQSSRAYR